jgi:hypothetical protein
MSLRVLDYGAADETLVDDTDNLEIMEHYAFKVQQQLWHLILVYNSKKRVKYSKLNVSRWLTYQNKRNSAYLFNLTTKWIASSFVPTSQSRIKSRP